MYVLVGVYNKICVFIIKIIGEKLAIQSDARQLEVEIRNYEPQLLNTIKDVRV